MFVAEIPPENFKVPQTRMRVFFICSLPMTVEQLKVVSQVMSRISDDDCDTLDPRRFCLGADHPYIEEVLEERLQARAMAAEEVRVVQGIPLGSRKRGRGRNKLNDAVLAAECPHFGTLRDRSNRFVGCHSWAHRVGVGPVPREESCGRRQAHGGG